VAKADTTHELANLAAGETKCCYLWHRLELRQRVSTKPAPTIVLTFEFSATRLRRFQPG
jgi:hypothetical protein